MAFRLIIFLISVLLAQLTFASSALELLKQKNHFAMIRHTRAPGTGDPANFDINDCTTQRNLSAEGLRQADALGKSLTETLGRDFWVFTSQWCRCVDTAKRLGGKAPTNLPVLNSFFQESGTGEAQTRKLKEWLNADLHKYTPLVLVTHQVNITGLTGVFPREGEVIVLKMGADGNITRVGSFIAE